VFGVVRTAGFWKVLTTTEWQGKGTFCDKTSSVAFMYFPSEFWFSFHFVDGDAFPVWKNITVGEGSRCMAVCKSMVIMGTCAIMISSSMHSSLCSLVTLPLIDLRLHNE